MDFKLGDEVLAPWLNDGFIYPAVLVALEGATAHVAYLDGDEADVPATQLRPGAFSPGLAVQVNWKGRRTYYTGSITQRVGMAIFMSYEDGSREWATIAQCRVQSAVAAALPAERVACSYCGASLDTRARHCDNCGGVRMGR